MSFRIVKFIIFLAVFVFGILLTKSFPFLEFNNDYWLPDNNQYQQDLNYLEREFQPGFGSIAVLRFPDSYFTEENIDFFRNFKHKVEDIDYVFKVNSPLDATVIINQEDMLTIQTYDEAFSDGNIVSIEDYQRYFWVVLILKNYCLLILEPLV